MAATCPSCGLTDPSPGRFCRDCGTPLSSSCPSCSAPVQPQQRFCAECGTPLSGAGRLTPQATGDAAQPSPVAERRVCSVLFCDLVGFTPLSESRDPEEVRELLSRYFATARTVIDRYGGVVEKFIGDAVMAVWGTPVALEGDTERAVRAASDLVATVQALGSEIGAPGLNARAGVVTGEVAVTIGATHEGMVAGDTVNTAARVQSAAEPGTVLVDAATRRLALAAVEFADAGSFELKGKAEPQQLWRAGRVLSGVGGAQRVDGLEAPLTGRDLELRLVKEFFHASVDRCQPRLVTVTGAAGVGKSRLGWEFEKYIDGLAASVWWHRGHCLSYGDGVSFWALAEIVRQRLDIAEDDPVDSATAKLREGIDKYVADPAERSYIGIRLGRLLGLAFDGETGQELAREELFAGWRLWFERLAAGEPVVLLIEDLHKADEGLLDFLDHLLDWARDVAIFVLTFSRPEMRVDRPEWGTGRNRSVLALDPLDAESVGRLLDALVPGIPADAAAAIAGQAHGIPLFVVETIRALIDRDVVVPRDGVYRLVGDIGTLTVPDSLHALLAARLDALDPDVRSLVADAAVLGSSFPLEALVAVSGRGEDEVRAGLADLMRREVFEISADALSPQRGNYRFAHDMLRQVAYGILSRHDRKARHIVVAEHLRTTFAAQGDEMSEVIARHYLDALAAVPDDHDVDATRAQAVEALVMAGERAVRTGALITAAANFGRAADLVAEGGTPDDGLRAAQLWERAASTPLESARSEVIIGYGTSAMNHYAAVGERRAVARVEAIIGRSLSLWGRFAEARERLERSLAVLNEEPDADTVVAMSMLALMGAFDGKIEFADRLTNEALTLAQVLEVPPLALSKVLVDRGVVTGFAGRLTESAAFHREGARIAEQGGDAAQKARALINLADIVGRSDPSAALAASLEAMDLCRRTGEPRKLMIGVINAAVARVEIGAWPDAEQGVITAREIDGLDDDATTMTAAWIAAMRGSVERAAALLADVQDALTSEDQQDQAWLATARAFLAAAEDRTDEVLRQGRTALENIHTLNPSTDCVRWTWGLAARAAHDLRDVATECELLSMLDGYRPGQLGPILNADRDVCLARLAPATEADALFIAAIAGLRERGTPYHLAHGLLDYAAFLTAAGRRDDAAPLVDEARRIGEELGAALVLRRVESAAPAAVSATA